MALQLRAVTSISQYWSAHVAVTFLLTLAAADDDGNDINTSLVCDGAAIEYTPSIMLEISSKLRMFDWSGK